MRLPDKMYSSPFNYTSFILFKVSYPQTHEGPTEHAEPSRESMDRPTTTIDLYGYYTKEKGRTQRGPFLALLNSLY